MYKKKGGRGRGSGSGRGLSEEMLDARMVRVIPRSKNGVLTMGDMDRFRGREVLPLHFLVECATGYTLIFAHGINDIDKEKYQAAEEYINRHHFPDKVSMLPSKPLCYPHFLFVLYIHVSQHPVQFECYAT
ncbi:hypothetical protein TSUD_187940 [Trifolium subterraneum]|uniref:Uncharacterized protein n=1 Tax=Trifolium subterraneum TaxID=3900 RepID=A0A2Z6PRT2_TRISU|nr:hypothetical protein TSUD_187940 [Trifolium subterraneum]